jgi:hypothetical protein
MPRFGVLLLCPLVAGVLMAAPAPFPKSGPWFEGWDKPVGDRRFDRDGDSSPRQGGACKRLSPPA